VVATTYCQTADDLHERISKYIGKYNLHSLVDGFVNVTTEQEAVDSLNKLLCAVQSNFAHEEAGYTENGQYIYHNAGKRQLGMHIVVECAKKASQNFLTADIEQKQVLSGLFKECVQRLNAGGIYPIIEGRTDPYMFIHKTFGINNQINAAFGIAPEYLSQRFRER
jgi:hypothetical protein